VMTATRSTVGRSLSIDKHHFNRYTYIDGRRFGARP
jgi:hypothetical protein